MGMEGGELGGKAETRRHKSNLRGLCISLSLAFFIHLSGGGRGRIAKRLGDMLFSRAG